MIKELIKLANELDRNGHRDLASKLDFILIENKDEIINTIKFKSIPITPHYI